MLNINQFKLDPSVVGFIFGMNLLVFKLKLTRIINFDEIFQAAIIA